TYFKFFTSGENAVIFKKTTTKNLNVAAAVLALLSLFMMVTGSICISMSLSKGVPFFLKPASFCFILSGILVFLSPYNLPQSVLSLLASDHSVPLHHDLSWSVACVGSAGAIVNLVRSHLHHNLPPVQSLGKSACLTIAAPPSCLECTLVCFMLCHIIN
ncbi:hypothetical protein SKAU_G00226180, partial [Synaphobranchus kaupii]